MELRYYQDFDKRDYVIPQEKEERFLYLIKKVTDMRSGKYAESARGHEITFNGEFARYRVSFRVGGLVPRSDDIWYKQTEEWFGNGSIGMPVRIVKIKEDFISYKKVKKIFGIYFSYGLAYTLSKWSFLRIFTNNKEKL